MPALLIADEPTGNLDETTGKEIMDLLFAKRAEHKSTLVLVTHDADLVKRCSRVVRMHSGQVEEAAASQAAMTRLR
jgi:putative ABC transport system ATP-binding protein